MSRRNRQRGHLHAVPDVGSSGAGSGPRHGRSTGQGWEPDAGPFSLDEADWLGLAGDDVPPLAALGIAREMAELGSAALDPPVDDILDQLAELGLPPDLLEESRALGGEHHAELAGLLRAATAMLSGDPVAGLLAVWQPLLDKKMNVFDAELAAAEILWSFNGATGDDGLVDGLTRLVEEAGSTGRPEALVMCRMLTHLGPRDVRSLTVRTANTLAAGGLQDRPWVSALGTAAFRRAYDFRDGPERALVVEFTYGRRPHAFVVVVDEPGGGLIGLFPTDEVDELAQRVRLDAMARSNGLAEIDAAEAARRIRSALELPMCAEDEADEAEMESLVPIVRERLRRLAAVPAGLAPTAPGAPAAGPAGGAVPTAPAGLAAPAARHPAADRDGETAGVAMHDGGPHPRARAKVVHRIKVTLAGVRPTVWRRLEVSSGLRLPALHTVLQLAFGWSSVHRWAFTVDGDVYGPGEPAARQHDPRYVTIGELVPAPGAAFEYRCHPGARRVRIRVEDVGPGDPEVGYPRCLAGRSFGPAESLDQESDVASFDINELNDQLDRYVRRRR